MSTIWGEADIASEDNDNDEIVSEQSTVNNNADDSGADINNATQCQEELTVAADGASFMQSQIETQQDLINAPHIGSKRHIVNQRHGQCSRWGYGGIFHNAPLHSTTTSSTSTVPVHAPPLVNTQERSI